jgi:hypothetical protein
VAAQSAGPKRPNLNVFSLDLSGRIDDATRESGTPSEAVQEASV